MTSLALDTQALREYVAATARPLAGLGWGHGRQAYLDLLADPLDSDAVKTAEGHVWSCALTTRGLWRKLGVQHSEIHRPYSFAEGDAMTRLIRIGDAFGGTRSVNGVDLPGIGDAVLINGGYHVMAAIVAMVEDELIPCVWHIDTVEGGQADAGGMCILPLKHTIVARDGKLYIGADVPTITAKIKAGTCSTIWKWIDVTTLKITVPIDTAPDKRLGEFDQDGARIVGVVDLPSERIGEPHDGEGDNS